MADLGRKKDGSRGRREEKKKKRKGKERRGKERKGKEERERKRSRGGASSFRL